MPGLNEQFPTELNAGLEAGLETLSYNQVLTFTKYEQVVLPLDGFVFWVASSLLSSSATFGASAFDTSSYDQEATIAAPPFTVQVKGSFHYSTEFLQTAEENYGWNRAIFTAQSPIDEFNVISDTVLYLTEVDGIKFAFSSRDAYYRQADLHHYRGEAIYPTMLSQIIDDPRQLDTKTLVVSNSLPIWLSFSGAVPIYPSFAMPSNVRPPYIAAHIEPSKTQAIQMAPSFDQLSNHYQLVEDTVRLTMFGLRNNQALDLQDRIFQASLDGDLFGIMNMPIIQEEKRPQNEINALANCKVLELRVNYYQTRVQNLARQLIAKAVPSYFPTE
jgi:hypothetical protein